MPVEFGDVEKQVEGIVVLHGALHKFFVALAAVADVDVEHVGTSVRAMFLVEARVLGGVHAAYLGAIGAMLRGVARSHALNKHHIFWLFVIGRPQHMSLGRARGRAQALELQAVEHILDFAAAHFRHILLIVEIEAGRHHDGTHILGHRLWLHVVVDGTRLANVLALAANNGVQTQTGIDVQREAGRDGLRIRNVDRAPRGQVKLVFVRHHYRADYGTFVAKFALVRIHKSGFLEYLDAEVTHGARNFLHFAIGHQLDLGMALYLDHLGRQNTLRTVQRGEGLGELEHAAADGGLLLDHDHLDAGIGDIEGSLNTGDAPTDDHCAPCDIDRNRIHRLVAVNPPHNTARNLDRLLGSLGLVAMNPAALLADISNFAGEIIDAGPLGIIAESLFMQVRRTAGDDDTVQLVVLDRLNHGFLTRFRTHVNVFLGKGNGVLTGHLLGHLRHIDGGGDVGAAMADKNAGALLRHDAASPFWLIIWRPCS